LTTSSRFVLTTTPRHPITYARRSARSRFGSGATILAAVTAIVIPIELAAGSGKHAQPGIAGGYMVSAGRACLGPTAQVMQSGRFVTISNTQSTLSGNLTLKNKHLTGTVTCVNHAKEAIDATPGTFRLTGRIGGQPLHAELVAQPPPAGTPTPLVPGSVSGVYAIAPSSMCLGTKMTLSGPSSRVKAIATRPGTRRSAPNGCS